MKSRDVFIGVILIAVISTLGAIAAMAEKAPEAPSLRNFLDSHYFRSVALSTRSYIEMTQPLSEDYHSVSLKKLSDDFFISDDTVRDMVQLTRCKNMEGIIFKMKSIEDFSVHLDDALCLIEPKTERYPITISDDGKTIIAKLSDS